MRFASRKIGPRNDGTTGTEETQMAAETSGMAADTSEGQNSGAYRDTRSSFDKAVQAAANGVPSGRYFRMSSL